MFRLLVVEDQIAFYEDYLMRFFGRLLPMEKISVTHVPTIKAALVALLEPWDVILMDYQMGSLARFLGDPVRNGADLTSFCRAVEQQRQYPASRIVGTSSTEVGNRFIRAKGADCSFLKLHVEDLKVAFP